MPSLVVRLEDLDQILNKAIRRMVLLSLAVHLVLLIRSGSKSTASWLDAMDLAQNIEDLPTVAKGSNHSFVESLSSSSSSSSLRKGNLSQMLHGGEGQKLEKGATAVAPAPPRTYAPGPADVRAPLRTARIPLEELVRSDPHPECDPGKSRKRLIVDTVLPDEEVYSETRRIPRIVHVTSKTRCMTPTFLKNIDLWRFPGYALYFHDDAAVDRLLDKYWPEFPQLQLLRECMVSGAAKADLWRLLVLWEYGGIYTDIDNAPGVRFNNGTVIQDDDQAWFVVERIGIMSQYFLAAAPRHPFVHTAILQLFERLLDVESISKQYVPFTTGPGTIKSAMILFMGNDESFQKVGQGKYVGMAGWTVTVVGTRKNSNEWVFRESVAGVQKKGGYTAMGMVHFGQSGKDATQDSCYEHLYKMQNERLAAQQRGNESAPAAASHKPWR